MAGQGFLRVGQGCKAGLSALTLHFHSLCRGASYSYTQVYNEIKGISVGNVECKISQFADDTTVILDGSQVSLERSFALLDSFGQLPGLRVNCEKTEVLWIGSRTGSNQIMCPEKKLDMGKWQS